MAIFTITFDLRGQGKKFDYTPFVEELRKQRCFQIQNSTWLGGFANDATQVHNHFRQLLDKSDSLLVSELFQHFCYTGSATGVDKWLAANKPAALPGAPDAPVRTVLPGQAAPAEAPKPAAKKPTAKTKAKAS